MKPLYAPVIKLARKVYNISNPGNSNFGRNWYMFPVKEYANNLIFEALNSERPVMVARLGANELLCTINYLGIKNPGKFKNIISFIQGKTPPWWWEDGAIKQLNKFAGFFPATIEKTEQFCELMLNDIQNCDILGSWLKEENFLSEQLINTKKVMLEDLEPFFSNNPWTAALKGRKVLVVHPFAETIEKQYQNHDKLFTNGLLPPFELQTIKAVQSIAGEQTPYSDWFEALDFMKQQISEKDFDICILGCGAYGFPLASYIKSIGKKAVHLGGITQLLFGIKGKRWETYIVYPYTNLYNPYWVRPGENEKPRNANIVEGACYW